MYGASLENFAFQNSLCYHIKYVQRILPQQEDLQHRVDTELGILTQRFRVIWFLGRVRTLRPGKAEWQKITHEFWRY